MYCLFCWLVLANLNYLKGGTFATKLDLINLFNYLMGW